MVSSRPDVERLAAVAADLGGLVDRVVFIGGAVAPLLQTDPPFALARATFDVDGVVASETYGDVGRLQADLIAHGFRQRAHATKHMHGWVGPSGIPFDLVPAGHHAGGSGNPWDAIALETAIKLELSNGIVIRHASAPAFLAQKWAAHHDRGHDDPLGSHDLEDILALLASRPTIVDEVALAPPTLRAHVGEQARMLLGNRDVEDILAAHLNNAQDSVATIDAVRALLHHLAGL